MSGKILVDFDSVPSKDQRIYGRRSHKYRISRADTGDVLKTDGPFRDKTEADNAALKAIETNKNEWEY